MPKEEEEEEEWGKVRKGILGMDEEGGKDVHERGKKWKWKREGGGDETQVLKRREERGEEKDRAITVNLVFAFNTCREEVMRREGAGRARWRGRLLGDRAYILNFNKIKERGESE